VTDVVPETIVATPEAFSIRTSPLVTRAWVFADTAWTPQP
jgi:hypothetical protein